MSDTALRSYGRVLWDPGRTFAISVSREIEYRTCEYTKKGKKKKKDSKCESAPIRVQPEPG